MPKNRDLPAVEWFVEYQQARLVPCKRRPRGHIEELASGSFRAIVYAGVDPLTRKPRYLKQTARTYAAAEVALTNPQGQVDDERRTRAYRNLVAAVLADRVRFYGLLKPFSK